MSDQSDPLTLADAADEIRDLAKGYAKRAVALQSKADEWGLDRVQGLVVPSDATRLRAKASAYEHAATLAYDLATRVAEWNT